MICVNPSSWAAIKNRKIGEVWTQIEHHLIQSICNPDKECLQVLTVDRFLRLLTSQIIAVGTIDAIHTHIRMIVEKSLSQETYGIILAHNHTSGITNPSWWDISYSRSLSLALHKLEVELVDHLVVGNDVFSLRQHAMLF